MKLTDQQLSDLIEESRGGSERLKFLATEAVHEIRSRRRADLIDLASRDFKESK